MPAFAGWQALLCRYNAACLRPRLSQALHLYIIYHYCPIKAFVFGLKPSAVLYFIGPTLKAGAITTKPFAIGL